MHFTQYYLDCLSQASYLIGDLTTGQAVVVDPRRDTREYLDDAAKAGLRIVGVINTHFHADFIAGHLELADQAGAWIGYGSAAQPDFEIKALADGERISLGEVTLEIMHTPGHTPESISVLVYEHANDAIPYGVLTGDALFIGDVGRPDLLASVGHSKEDLAKALYHSVQHKLMGLDDAVRVFPAHGAGSACGKNLSTERQSTIGEQRRSNYACQPMSESEFMALVTAGQPSAPEYFLFNATQNKGQRDTLQPDRQIPALSDAEVAKALADGAVILDVRDPVYFATGHLRGSLNVGFDGRLSETVGMMLAPAAPIIIVADEAIVQESALRLSRIGFDNSIGYIPDFTGYFERHPEQVVQSSRLTPDGLQQNASGDVQVLDVRNVGELENGVVDGSVNIPLAELKQRWTELDANSPVIVYCAGGWRSSVAASFLRSKGLTDVSDVIGGYSAISPQTACANS